MSDPQIVVLSLGVMCICHSIANRKIYLSSSMHPPVMFSAPPKGLTLGRKCQRHYVHPTTCT
uniref:SFRICE_020021 n=1 Tax=Spodoptera frugiperda TaxID=7108 RepID=A0A2H1VBR7_SPOFR